MKYLFKNVDMDDIFFLLDRIKIIQKNYQM